MNEQNQSQGQTQNIPKKKVWYKKWWVIVIGVVLLFVIIGSFGSDDKSKENQSQQASQGDDVTQKVDTKKEEKPVEVKEVVPQVTVTSAVIAKDYSENEVAADEKYKGKIIEVSGKVASVDNGILDNEMIVKLSDGEYDFSGPMCYMEKSEREKVLAFKKGDKVTLIGEGNSATIGSPMLKDCTVK